MADEKEQIINNDTLFKTGMKYLFTILFFALPFIFLYFNFIEEHLFKKTNFFFLTKNYYYYYIIFFAYIPLLLILQKFYSYFLTSIIVCINLILLLIIGTLTFFKYFDEFGKPLIRQNIYFLGQYDYVFTLLIGIISVIIYCLILFKFFDKLENNEVKYKVNIENLYIKTVSLNNQAIETRDKIQGHKEIIKKFNMLNRISANFLSENNSSNVIKIFISKLEELFKPDNFFILINNNQNLNISEKIFFELNQFNGALIEQLVNQFKNKYSPLFIDNLEKNIQFNSLTKYCNYSSIIVVPLLHINNLIGNVGIFYNKEKVITQYHLRLLNYISNIFSVSLCSSLLYSETEKKAQKDGLTELYKRWYFEQELIKELNIAKRYKNSLSLIMIDIDYFKNLNDTYGHALGDTVLKKISEIFLNIINRPIEVACRWGGEEFIILLPGKNKNHALSLAELIRKEVKQNLNINEISEKITVSLGVATYPVDSEKMKELLLIADQALYKAKNNGRNQVAFI